MEHAAWRSCEDPARMLAVVTGEEACQAAGPGPHFFTKLSDRKLIKFACACRWACGRYLSADSWSDESGWGPWDDDRDMTCPNTDWLPERFARLFLGDDQPSVATPPAQAAILRDIAGDPWAPLELLYGQACPPRCTIRSGLRQHYRKAPTCGACRTDWRCPWLTPQVLSLAQGAYDERNADGTLDGFRLALLADALEEAGMPADEECRTCDGSGWFLEGEHRFNHPCPCRATGRVPNPLLAHLRSPGPHYRGCDAIDCILGKS